MRDAPPLEGVLETALYHEPGQRGEIEGFYGEVLGLPLVTRWDDGLAFRAGPGVLLLFDRHGLERRSGPIADHGATGPGHACLRVAGPMYERWRGWLVERGVEIVHDHEWSDGKRSFYFRDPAGNLLEIADADLWPSASDG
jgi:catechol 2,3-dioxygenase-like lactoylglutathione lyase family enzyme